MRGQAIIAVIWGGVLGMNLVFALMNALEGRSWCWNAVMAPMALGMIVWTLRGVPRA